MISNRMPIQAQPVRFSSARYSNEDFKTLLNTIKETAELVKKGITTPAINGFYGAIFNIGGKEYEVDAENNLFRLMETSSDKEIRLFRKNVGGIVGEEFTLVYDVNGNNRAESKNGQVTDQAQEVARYLIDLHSKDGGMKL